MTVYGSSISYFTGKLEMYLRAKGISYLFEPMDQVRVVPEVEKHTGNRQMPAVKLADGRWITDTTPIIAWLEPQYPDSQIVPQDPLQRFFNLLVEDYADEWLWRPAMHFRWWPIQGRMVQSRLLADELTSGIPAPGFLRRWMLRRRQLGGYVLGDGVTKDNHEQVEDIYFRNLAWLEDILQAQDFLMGNSPCLADIAYMGPMFRHFAIDPVPAEIMRVRAPAVWAWIARVWNCTPRDCQGDWVAGIPDSWDPLLNDIGCAYLPYLNDNAEAVAAGDTRFSPSADGVDYHRARVSPYRVWCLAELRSAYEALDEASKQAARERLERTGCWAPLWSAQLPEVDVNRGYTLPFGTNAKMV